jgi:hypothetical protein
MKKKDMEAALTELEVRLEREIRHRVLLELHNAFKELVDAIRAARKDGSL